MPAAEYTTTAKLPVETIWDFVKEMDNWARYVTGYRSHEKQSDTESVWVLKGDVGVLARTLEFQVHITEWNGPSRVRFELRGVNEPMEGSGSFEMAIHEMDVHGTDGYEEEGAAPPEKKSAVLRLLEAVVRFFMRLFGGGAPERASARGGPGAEMAKLTFRLELEPGGPMAPMVSAMMKPAMLPAAEKLAGSIMAHLEAQHGARA